MARLGHVAERRQIIAFGADARQLAAAVHRGGVRRLRRAWYAGGAASREQCIAVRIGGALGGPSAAASYGFWTPTDSRIHVSVPHNAARLRTVEDDVEVILDWSRPPGPLPVFAPAWRVDPATAIQQSARHLQDDELIALMDSAFRSGRVTRPGLAGRIPARLLAQTDPSAESGIESLARVRIRRLGLPVRTQVVVPGVGRLDLLVGDRLVIETDGREFHEAPDRFASDRRRDLELMALGLVVLRLSYAQVVHEWASVEDVILRLVDRREHLSRVPYLRRTSADAPAARVSAGVSRRRT